MAVSPRAILSPSVFMMQQFLGQLPNRIVIIVVKSPCWTNNKLNESCNFFKELASLRVPLCLVEVWLVSIFPQLQVLVVAVDFVSLSTPTYVLCVLCFPVSSVSLCPIVWSK